MVDLFEDGPPRWHCLVVSAQRETHAERWLDLRGVYSFHPITERYKVIKGKRRRFVKRYLPGYVFARFPGDIITHRVVGTPFIRDMIRLSDGRPACLNPHDLRQLHAMRDIDTQQQNARAEAKRIRKGDRIRIVSGVLAGTETEALELSNGKVHFTIQMFSADQEATASLSDIEKVA